jgi:hypothetical protein
MRPVLALVPALGTIQPRQCLGGTAGRRQALSNVGHEVLGPATRLDRRDEGVNVFFQVRQFA